MSDTQMLIKRLRERHISYIAREWDWIAGDKRTEVRTISDALCNEAADALADLQAKLDVATADISACRALLGEAAQVLENVGKHKPGWGEPDDWPVVGRLKGARYPLNGDCVRAAALAAKIRERLG